MEESPSSSHLSCLTTHARSADYHAKLAEVEDNLRKAREARAMQVLAVLFALLPGVGPHTIHATVLRAGIVACPKHREAPLHGAGGAMDQSRAGFPRSMRG